MAERSRDDEAVERHLEGARVDLGTRERVGVEGRIFGGLPDGDAGQMRAEYLLQEAECPFEEGSVRPRTGMRSIKSTNPSLAPWYAKDFVKVAQDMRVKGDSSPWPMMAMP